MTLNIYWITVIEVRWYTLDVTSLPIFITPIFTLFVVALLNWLLRLYRRATLFTGAELTVVYIIMVTGAVFAGHDMLQNLFGTIAYLQRHGTPETGWRERFFAYVPHALFRVGRGRRARLLQRGRLAVPLGLAAAVGEAARALGGADPDARG
jgi:hypothetical protein